jgi:hypothetical protein
MAGITTRQEARDHVLITVKKLLDQMIPEDEKQPVKDGVFWEWEEMADEFDRGTTASLMEALAGLSAKAKLSEPGVCPTCDSKNTRWLDEEKQLERQSKHGVVVVPRQVARCRSCGRSFSPSGGILEIGSRGASDAAGGGAGEPGSGATAL